MTSERWGKGYSQGKVEAAQDTFDLVLLPDLVALLRERRPLAGHAWTDATAIKRALDWPRDSPVFDVENDGFWWPQWGQQPAVAEAQTEVVRSALTRAPKLIPLHSHRCLPEEPHEVGNPMFSVYRSNTIYYSCDLADYFKREFNGSDDRRP